jgi:hypothetical protein
MSARRVLVFARAPVPGRVKTRLAPVLGEEGAAALHRRLVRRTLAIALAALPGPGAVELWCTPDTRHPFFTGLAAELGVRLRRQVGSGLGERMSGALRAALAETGPAVLIGTDCADCGAADLDTALTALEAGSPAVLGPALDGGYWLLGLLRWSPRLFDGIDWGSARVLDQTRAALAELGWRWTELAARRDVDRPADLAGLPRDLLPRPPA